VLEIAILVWLYRTLATIAAEKQLNRLWGALGPVLWIGGELGGAIVGALLGFQGAQVYVTGLLGGVLGA
jgi:hypothetical protein